MNYHIVFAKLQQKEILRLAHEIPFAGHLEMNTICDKILTHLFWPGLRRDVANACKSCQSCQRVRKLNQKIPSAPLKPIPSFGDPFSQVIIDCVGPSPKTKTGNK